LNGKLFLYCRKNLRKFIRKLLNFPDISTRAKARAYLGIDIKTLDNKIRNFILNLISGWNITGKEREKTYE